MVLYRLLSDKTDCGDDLDLLCPLDFDFSVDNHYFNLKKAILDNTPAAKLDQLWHLIFHVPCGVPGQFGMVFTR